MKQVVPPPCPEWYGDTEWNVSLWGTYLFTGNDWEDDEYLETDHAWGGGGVIFGGGETDTLVIVDTDPTVFGTVHNDGDAEWIAQIGAGFEVRLTRHIGIINDFSWNFVGRDNSDFGMIRSGINFAF